MSKSNCALVVVAFLIICSCSDDNALNGIDPSLIGTWRSVQIRLIDSEGENAEFDLTAYPVNNYADSFIYRFNKDRTIDFSVTSSRTYSTVGDSLFFHMTEDFTRGFRYSVDVYSDVPDTLFVIDRVNFSGLSVTTQAVFFKTDL